MIYEPKKYQELAIQFLRTHKRCALFLDMGLGKTVVTLTYVKELLDDFAVHKVLVIAPLRVAEDTWTREADKWEHLHDLAIAKVLGSAKDRRAALNTQADVYVINRENVQWLVEECGEHWDFDMVIIDELSSFKSPTAKRFRYLKRVMKMVNRVIGLTGTPAANGYMDLYAEMYLIDKGETLGSTLTAYRNKYFSAGAHKGYIVYEWRLKSGAKKEIDRRLAKYCLSMSKEDWLTLPPIIYNNIVVRMDAAERKVYDEFQKEKVLPLLNKEQSTLDNMDSAIVGETAAVLSGKLLQMANGAVYDDKDGVFHVHDRKLDALKEIVESAQGQPVLVFYSYKHDLNRIKEIFPDAVQLKDANDISAWNKGEISMLLCHPASTSYGINLQEGGHIIVWFGLPWSWELYTQAVARLYRQGQEQSVIVHHIICEDTLDERVLKALHQKENVERSLLNALKEYLNDKV